MNGFQKWMVILRDYIYPLVIGQGPTPFVMMSVVQTQKSRVNQNISNENFPDLR